MYLPDKAGRRRATTVFLLPSLVGIIGFCLLPIAGSLFFSLMDYDLLRPMESMTFVGLKNFVRVLTGREFRGVLAHTFTYLGLYLPLIMAASVLSLIPVLIVFLSLQKYFVEGVAATGVKG